MSEGHERASQRNGHTGPKTTAGKRRSSDNARKHGLAAKKGEVDAAMGRIGQLAAALAAALHLRNAAEDLIQQAAESQSDIEKIRMLKAITLAKALFDRADSPGAGLGAALPTVSLDWQRLERYERRAFKRRQEAFFKIGGLNPTGFGKVRSSS